MDSDSVWRHIDQQRSDLADLFESIDGARWSTPSLCDGWTVRDVAVHLTHSHMSIPRIVLEAARSGFRFNAMVHRTAVQDSRTPMQAADALRTMRGSRRKPPGTSACEPLIDVLVHGQDITVPLGIEWPMPTDAAAAAAERVWGMGFPFHAQRRLRDVELVGADADFHLGEGRRIEAPIRDILMEVAGRPSSISPAITASDRPAAQA